MSIQFTCPHCGRSANVADTYAGRSGPCVECGEPITIPSATPRQYCRRCGTPAPLDAMDCSQCGAPLDARPPGRIGDDPALRMILPVGRSALAIVAGYLGLFSVLFVFAPFAVITGALAIRDIRRNPEKHGMGRAIFGLVMGIIFTVALLIMLGAALFESLK